MAVASSWTGYSPNHMVPGLETFSSFQSDQPMGVSYGASPRTTSMLVVQSWQILKQHSRPRLHRKLVLVKTKTPNIWPNILSSLGPMLLLIQQPNPLSLGPLQQPEPFLSSSFPISLNPLYPLMKKAGKSAYLDNPKKEEGKGGVRAEMAVEEGVIVTEDLLLPHPLYLLPPLFIASTFFLARGG